MRVYSKYTKPPACFIMLPNPLLRNQNLHSILIHIKGRLQASLFSYLKQFYQYDFLEIINFFADICSSSLNCKSKASACFIMLPNPQLQTKTGSVFLFKLLVHCKPLITVIKTIQQDIRLLFRFIQHLKRFE